MSTELSDARHKLVIATNEAQLRHRELARAVIEGNLPKARDLLDEVVEDAQRFTDLGRHAGL